jgi:hypothetical protein
MIGSPLTLNGSSPPQKAVAIDILEHRQTTATSTRSGILGFHRRTLGCIDLTTNDQVLMAAVVSLKTISAVIMDAQTRCLRLVHRESLSLLKARLISLIVGVYLQPQTLSP